MKGAKQALDLAVAHRGSDPALASQASCQFNRLERLLCGLCFRVKGVGFGFMVYGVWFMFYGLRFKVEGSVLGAGARPGRPGPGPCSNRSTCCPKEVSCMSTQ